MIRPVTIHDFDGIIEMLRFLRLESPEYGVCADDKDFVLGNLHAMHLNGMLFGVLDEHRGLMLGAMTNTWYSRTVIATEQLLFVYPPYRGSSLAVRLIRAFEQEARSRGATALHVGASTGIQDERTVRMYSRLGYEHKGTSLSKSMI